MAAPAVSGVAAAIMAHRPDLTGQQIAGALMRTADDADTSAPGSDSAYGWGRIVPMRAVSYLDEHYPPTTAPPTTSTTVPVPPTTPRAVSVSADHSHTCELRDNGTVRCWGRNLFGELGNGTVASSLTPVEVAGLTGVSAITTGGDFSCALLNDGTVKWWGYDYATGVGDRYSSSLIPIQVPGLTGVTSISSGSSHSCAVLEDRTVQCWGENVYGPTESNVITATPEQIAGLGEVIAVAAGLYHTCVLEVDRTVRCWGRNTVGILGNGATIDSTTPVRVAGLVGVVALEAGDLTTCALLGDGTVRCWETRPATPPIPPRRHPWQSMD